MPHFCHRTNLKYEVRTKKGKAGSVQEIASLIQNYFCDGKTGRVQSGIVYCLSQRDCDDTADKLASMVRGLTVKPYHAGLDNKVRSQTQQDWIQDKVNTLRGVLVLLNTIMQGLSYWRVSEMSCSLSMFESIP